jgi:hypothetical protein
MLGMTLEGRNDHSATQTRLPRFLQKTSKSPAIRRRRDVAARRPMLRPLLTQLALTPEQFLHRKIASLQFIQIMLRRDHALFFVCEPDLHDIRHVVHE